MFEGLTQVMRKAFIILFCHLASLSLVVVSWHNAALSSHAPDSVFDGGCDVSQNSVQTFLWDL